MNFSLPERFDDDGVLNAIMQFQNLEDVSDLVFDFRRVGYVFPFPTLFAPMFAIQSLGGGEKLQHRRLRCGPGAVLRAHRRPIFVRPREAVPLLRPAHYHHI